jgi:large subunit ribosomal protein L22
MPHGIPADQLATRTTRKGATIVKTNERPGTRAQVKFVRISAYKVREVLDIIRGRPVDEAIDVLQFTDRAAAEVVRKCLASAVANARANDDQDEGDLYVSACYADEGPTLKRWRPRARGRATRIRKRTCHVTVIVGRMPVAMAERVRAKRAATVGAARPVGRAAKEARRARVARSRQAAAPESDHDHDHDHEEDEPAPSAAEAPAEAAAETEGDAEGSAADGGAIDTVEDEPEAEELDQEETGDAAGEEK